MIREVIFDIDDTLYNYETGHALGMKRMGEYARKEFGVEPEEFESMYKKLNREIIEHLGRDNAAIHSRSIRLQNMLEQWGKPLFPHLKTLYHLYWDTLIDESSPEPGSLEAMRELCEMGISIGIGTDMTTAMQYEKLERFGFGPYIRHIVTSQEAGYEKPHPVFMSLCLQKADCAPEECVFVGDTFKKDVLGALNTGMRAVWYNAKGKQIPEDADLAGKEYKEIRHFDELVPYIRSLSQG